MKKRILALAALIALAAVIPAGAFDFGMTITSDSTYTKQDEGSFQQLDQAIAWASSPLGQKADLYLSFLYEFKGDFASGSSEIEPWRIDAGRIELSGTSPGAFGPSSALRYSVGRIRSADFSELVLSGLSDGARLEADFGNASLSFAAGYRGLLYKDDAYSYLSANDLAIAADEDEYFAPERAFAALGFRLAELIDGHELGVELLGQFDLSDASDKVHSQYFEPYVKGRLNSLIGWDAWGIVELVEADDSSWALALGQSLTLSLPEAAGLKIKQSAAWASGDDGSMSAFSPIRRATIDATSYFAFTDLLKLGLEASISPLRHLTATLGTAAYFRTGEVDPESTKQLEADAAYYRGFEISASATAKPASDLSLMFSGGLLVPNNASAYAEDEKNRITAELYAAFDL